MLHLEFHPSATWSGLRANRMRARSWRASGPKTAETAAEFGLRVDVQPETAAVGPLVDASPRTPQMAARRRCAAAAAQEEPSPLDTRRPLGSMTLIHRPRRLRSTSAMRRLVAETSLEPRHLVLPMFVADGIDAPRPIGSMLGLFSTPDSLRRSAVQAVEARRRRS